MTAPAPDAERNAGATRGAVPGQPGLVRIFPRPLDRAPDVWSGRKKLLVGRVQEADIQLAEPSVSRRHAEVRCSVEGVRITDLDSRHGTFVDGSRVGQSETAVDYGCVIRAGESLFLAVEDVRRYAAAPFRIRAEQLAMKRDALAGPQLGAVWEQAARVAALSHPVLVLGESGTGKEAVARLIHTAGKARGPFVAINLAAIPQGLFESELFGHARGAFTGAAAARPGAFREAHGGVLFLDEVADLQIDLQVKLLRALDQMRVRPLGASEDVPVDVRIVAATSQDLRALCERGAFRLDLYYRLSGMVITLPPLRERPDDVLLLAQALLAADDAGLSLSAAAAEALARSAWPGNVRELQHAVTYASVQAAMRESRLILPEHLPALSALPREAPDATSLGAVQAALTETRGNAAAAARLLGIARTTLYNVLKREGIDPRTARVD